MKPDDRERVIERIRQLQTLAQRGATDGEMAAASAAVHRLLRTHGLSMADVEREPDDDRIDERDVRMASWHGAVVLGSLAAQVAGAFECRALRVVKGNTRIVHVQFMGTDADAEVAAHLFETLQRIVWRRAIRLARLRPKRSRQRFRDGYVLGAAASIGMRLDLERADWLARDVDAGALVVSKRAAIDRELARYDVRERDVPPDHDVAAAIIGFREGRDVPLTRGLRGGHTAPTARLQTVDQGS